MAARLDGSFFFYSGRQKLHGNPELILSIFDLFKSSTYIPAMIDLLDFEYRRG